MYNEMSVGITKERVFYMTKAIEFITKHEMGYETIDVARETPRLLQEMQAGLDGAASSLLMIPSYIVLKNHVQREKKVLCVDAGGTNLRLAVCEFSQDGEFKTGEIAKYKMPGSEKELEAQEFFDVMAELIAPYTKITKDIVISFAYRASITPEIDCKIIEITKEVKVKGAGGKLLAYEIGKSLHKKGIDHCKMIVVNDSVATALSGKAEKLNDGYGTFTGTILGTGSNSCYIESLTKIGKLAGVSKDGVMVINTEAGSYDKMHRSDIDRAYDATTLNAKVGVFEKMTSGGYLGSLCGFTLKKASEENVFEAALSEDILKIKTVDVSEFLKDGNGALKAFFASEKDRESAREILANIIKRAGNLLALQMAAIAKKAVKLNNKVCMTVEGTTYEKMFGLKKQTLEQLLPYLKSQGIEADVITVELAVLKGCAIAGLSR
ncbi:MAG: hypothetical protein RR413_01465 [Christensenellaceae bacterium]